MKVIVGTKNPLKLKAVKIAFTRIFDEDISIIGVDAPSGVSSQPVPGSEVLKGAKNRAEFCKDKIDGDYFVGVEGGLTFLDDFNDLFLTGFVVVLSNDNEIIGVGNSGLIQIPEDLRRLIEEKGRISGAVNEYFGVENSKHALGVQGHLTNGEIDRAIEVEQNTIRALTLHKFNGKVYG
ncbi:MAG: inosine/xanthosine triphosphatase [Alphaproteobacteria bacterium]|jgi:inosine/xanthosine triphosphatase|nr:inosine/xanthosine triphosphatase [Alphaproteobacteria bacterium]